MCLGALIPNRTRFLPTSRMVISMSSATMIFWSFLRLMISIQYPFDKNSLSLGEIQDRKKYKHFRISALQFFKAFWHTGRVFHMKKYFFSTTWLILFFFSPTYAQQIPTRSESPSAEARPNLPTRLATVS